MYLLLTTKEWLGGLRTYALPAVLLSLLVLLGIAFAGTHSRSEQISRNRSAANAHFRQQWEQLKTSDPHSAAHFGTYLFKPVMLLSNFDSGLETVTGTSMRIEAHVQHTMAAPVLRPADIYTRFGSLTIASVLQLFFPLFIIFSCYNSYTQEKTNGTLRLLLIQGATQSVILKSKTKYYLIAVNIMLLASLLIYLPALLFSGTTTTTTDQTTLLSILCLIIAYSSYCSIFVMIAIAISAIAKNARQSLLLLTGCWLIWNILLPRLGAGIAGELHPLPSQYQQQEKMEKAIKMGIDGRSSREERIQQLTDATLKQYHVKSADQLPVNLHAILLQSSEDYAQMVYDIYTAKTDSIITLQNRYSNYLALVDPYLAIRNLSMALCGTDYLHQQQLDRAARQYRNDFIRRLNNELAYGGSKTNDSHWKVNASFYSSIPPFHYKPPALIQVLASQWMMIAALLLWLAISICLLQIIARHAGIE
ncbi:ABC transporter permease [Chitinophaga pinensis]|uniref:DUF3526 domain-containing protein n=1 Tax=Chitinophaga pinensis (strain ATCC 43595 / DSM 2588 / LMG 13176 / NBRC 15968 / NCIMB 11800 / UQM 2034) TaxID=485918 RepID=A0A979G8S4_CHIPD|nr:DUF3526 domain-containing protein [Chitinophaga pinensis]ACU62753.1 hypothetical protein Cpin_5322 [Chitinophaga pinensis DSM 2588]